MSSKEDRYAALSKEEKYASHSKYDKYSPPSREDRHSNHERSNKQRKSLSPPKSGQSQTSLSIEETNKLRAKLGLKPLEVDSGPKEGTDLIKDDLGEFHHKPAINVVEKERSQKIKEKIALMKEKRKIESSLTALRTLGESDSEDDATIWIKKSRKIEEEKKKAAERVHL